MVFENLQPKHRYRRDPAAFRSSKQRRDAVDLCFPGTADRRLSCRKQPCSQPQSFLSGPLASSHTYCILVHVWWNVISCRVRIPSDLPQGARIAHDIGCRHTLACGIGIITGCMMRPVAGSPVLYMVEPRAWREKGYNCGLSEGFQSCKLMMHKCRLVIPAGRGYCFRFKTSGRTETLR